MDNIILDESLNSRDYIKNMLLKMKILKASDLYLSWGLENVLLRYRVNGFIIKEHYILSKDFAEQIQYTLIALSGEDESLKIIDGKFIQEINGKNEEYRFSSAETINGSAIVIRQYEFFNTNLTLDNLGYMPEVLELMKKIVNENRYGLFLVTGPTGSGKTTSLYTYLNTLYKNNQAIIKTIEDPVEVYLDGIDQLQINIKGDKKYHITYNNAIKTFLRQKPDYILIGEIRDDEVAEYTFRASFTGHFVFSTLHTGSVENTLSRLFDLGITKDKIEDSLCGVLNQILIPKLCDCKIKNKDGFYERNENGCEKCKNNIKHGYNDSIVVSEIAEFSRGINNFKKENWKNYISLKDNLDYLYKNGIIDIHTYNFYLPK